MKKIINCETGEIIERELTEEELARQAKDEQTTLKLDAEIEAKAEQRREILDRLGLTEQEAKLLLG